MADNTTLNAGTGGDVVLTIDKISSTGAKVQAVVLDAGGGDGTGESIVNASNPLPSFDADADVYHETTESENWFQALVELRVMNRILFEGLGLRGDLDKFRADEIATLVGVSSLS